MPLDARLAAACKEASTYTAAMQQVQSSLCNLNAEFFHDKQGLPRYKNADGTPLVIWQAEEQIKLQPTVRLLLRVWAAGQADQCLPGAGREVHQHMHGLNADNVRMPPSPASPLLAACAPLRLFPPRLLRTPSLACARPSVSAHWRSSSASTPCMRSTQPMLMALLSGE